MKLPLESVLITGTINFGIEHLRTLIAFLEGLRLWDLSLVIAKGKRGAILPDIEIRNMKDFETLFENMIEISGENRYQIVISLEFVEIDIVIEYM